MQNDFTVYMHKFPNGKVYIGITQQTVFKRWNYGRGYDRQTRMRNAINKYGWDNVDHIILHENISKSEAEELEIKYISDYRANERDYGYNISNGGNHIGTVSQETRKKMSESHKGRILSDETRKRISLSWSRRVVSNETRKKLSISSKGRKNSPETRKKISESKIGKPHPAPEHMKRKVVQIDIDTCSVIHFYSSIIEASKETSISAGHICQCLNGNRLQSNGYVWITREEYESGVDINALVYKAKYNKRFHKICAVGLHSKEVVHIFNSVLLTAEHYSVSKETIKRMIKQNREVLYLDTPVILQIAD